MTDEEEIICDCKYCMENPTCYKQILEEQLARKTTECEELKSQIETYSKMLENPEFKIALTDVRTGEREVWRKLGNKAQRYKQALDEIEDIVFGDYEIIDSLGKQQILNIISKAKDGE